MYKIIKSKALGNHGTGTIYNSCRFDIGSFCAKPTNYEQCLHPSDTCAYHSAHNNLFLTLRVIHKLKIDCFPQNWSLSDYCLAVLVQKVEFDRPGERSPE